MKWILGVLAFGFFFAACDNDLIVTDEWKDIPVVWGLLYEGDTAHYIRVEKAFLDPTTSALDIARIPDSLYYDNATVLLKRVNTGQLFMLEMVNGDLEGYPREGGIFAESPNYLFKIHSDAINLVIGETYEFQLDREGVAEPVTAMTIILPKPVLRVPSPSSFLPFKRGTQFTFMWNEMPDAGIFDLKLRFHYREKSPETGNQFVPRFFEWDVANNLLNREYKMDGIDFYTTIKSSINEDFQATRLFDSVDIIVWAGGKELAQFIRLAQANTGITSTQDIPRYTNLSEGIGIFSSRSVSYVTGFQLTANSLDSLRDGSITRDLNFQ